MAFLERHGILSNLEAHVRRAESQKPRLPIELFDVTKAGRVAPRQKMSEKRLENLEHVKESDDLSESPVQLPYFLQKRR